MVLLDTSQKKRRRAPRRKGRSEKRACSDTIEDSSSSASAADAQYYKESSPLCHKHIQTNTSLHLHITTFSMHSCCSHDEWYHERASFISLSLKAFGSKREFRMILTVPLGLAHGGAGKRLGGARNPGLARTTGTDQQQTSATRVTDDSTKRGILCQVAKTPRISDSPATQLAPGRNSNLANTSGARSADQILRVFEQSQITASCCAWSKTRDATAAPRKAVGMADALSSVFPEEQLEELAFFVRHERCCEQFGNEGTEDQGAQETREHGDARVPEDGHRDSSSRRRTPIIMNSHRLDISGHQDRGGER